MRNEAVDGFGRLIPLGCASRGRGFGIRFLGGYAVLFGLEAAEFLEGVTVIAMGGIDAALEAAEIVAIGSVGLRDSDFLFGHEAVDRAMFPELGFADTEAAEEPLGVDEGVDEHALFGSGGTEAVVIFSFESLEVDGFFAADDLRFGVDAGFEGIHGGAGLALRGAGAGGFLCVEAVGLDLLLGWHTAWRIAGRLSVRWAAAR
jgi:hypothetical protein